LRKVVLIVPVNGTINGTNPPSSAADTSGAGVETGLVRPDDPTGRFVERTILRSMVLLVNIFNRLTRRVMSSRNRIVLMVRATVRTQAIDLLHPPVAVIFAQVPVVGNHL
jgi:hypothetical protein